MTGLHDEETAAPALLPPLCGLFIGGMIGHDYFPYLRWLVPLSVLLVIGPVLHVRGRPGSRRSVWLLGVLFFLVGAGVAAWRTPVAPAGIELPAGKISLAGEVVSIPRLRHDRIRFVLNNEVYGRVRVSTEAPADVLPGDRVAVRGRLKAIRGFLNPGLPSDGERMARQGVFYRLWSPRVEIRTRKASILGSILQARARLARRFDVDFAPAQAGFLKAVVLGISDLPEATREAFARSGTAHLLAVSGTHLSVLMGLVVLVVRAGLRRMPPRLYVHLSQRITAGQLAFLISIPVVTGYALLAGARIPALRSLLMIACFGVAVLTNRARHWPSILSAAALVILALEPWALYELSFQLTFLAVVAIGTLALPVVRSFPGDREVGAEARSGGWGLCRKAGALLVVSVAASIGTAPLVARRFHQVSLVAPAANLFAMPLVGVLAIPLGLVHAGLLLVFGQSFLTGVLAVLSDGILWLADFFSGLSFAAFPSRGPGVLLLAGFGAVLLAPLRFGLRLALLLGLGAVSVLMPAPARTAAMTMIDVGQGEAMLFELPDGQDMLVDTGGLAFFDVGHRIVAPFLLSKGIRRLDRVVLTHAHPDHAGGLAAIARKLPVRELLWNGHEADLMDRLQKALVDTTFRVVSAGDRWRGPGYEVEVLHPPDDRDGRQGRQRGRNSRSLVLGLSLNGTDFLLTGDIDRRAERSLLHGAPRRLRAHVLKVPHHGGTKALDERFLASVDPSVALVSAGYGNRFGHPRPETLALLRRAGVRVFRTDRDGAVRVEPGRNGALRILRWRDYRPRPAESAGDIIENLRRLFLESTTGGVILSGEGPTGPDSAGLATRLAQTRGQHHEVDHGEAREQPHGMQINVTNEPVK